MKRIRNLKDNSSKAALCAYDGGKQIYSALYIDEFGKSLARDKAPQRIKRE